MTNRKERRAEKAEMPDIPKMRNLSGTDQCCANCPRRANEKNLNWNRMVLRMPKVGEDSVICLATPNPIEKHRVDWCSLWGEPNVVKIEGAQS
jgi:hypothetical protein